MLLFEEDDVTAAGANIAQALVLNALGIRADPTWALKAHLCIAFFLGTRLGIAPPSVQSQPSFWARETDLPSDTG